MKKILSFYRLAFKLLRESIPYVLAHIVLTVFLGFFFGFSDTSSHTSYSHYCEQSKTLYGVPPSQLSFFRKVVSFLYGIAEIIFWGYLFAVIVVIVHLLFGGFFKDVLFFVYFLLYCLFAPFILGVLHLLSLKYSDNLPPSDSFNPFEEEYF